MVHVGQHARVVHADALKLTLYMLKLTLYMHARVVHADARAQHCAAAQQLRQLAVLRGHRRRRRAEQLRHARRLRLWEQRGGCERLADRFALA